MTRGTCEFKDVLKCVTTTTAGNMEAVLDKSMRACTLKARCLLAGLQVVNTTLSTPKPKP